MPRRFTCRPAVGAWPVVLGLLLWCASAGAEPRLRGTELSVLVDPAGAMAPAAALAADGWVPLDAAVPSFGFRDETFWFRLPLVNGQDAPVERYVEILYPMLDRVHVFVAGPAGIDDAGETGDALPFDRRPLAHRNLLLPVVLPPGESVLLLRVRSTGVVQLPLRVWEPRDFVEHDELRAGVEGAFFGVMIVMIVYNLFLFLTLREARYLYYVCHVAVSTLFLATLHGLAHRYLWPDALWWQERAVPTLVALSVVFIALFVTSFLGIRRGTAWGRFFQVLAAVAAATAVGSLFLPYEAVLRTAGLLSIVALAASLTVSVRGWVAGKASARYLVFAWSAFVLGGIALALNKFGILPSVPLTEQGMLIGSVLDVVLLSLALADRFREERQLREDAQRRAFVVEAGARERLERSVADRTGELNAAMLKLREANEKLERLSNVDGLTGVHNRRYFDRMLAEHWQAADASGEDLALALFDVDHFKAINDRLGHLQGDDVLRLIARRIGSGLADRDHVLARYGGEEFAVLLPGLSLLETAALADDLRRAIAELRIPVGDEQLEVRVSGGVAGRTGASGSATDLVDRADEALYRAKRGGRDRICSAGA